MAVVINGSGTVTGLAVGGLPDGTVDAGTLATDSVTAVKIPDTVEADLKSGRKNLIINGAMQVAQRGTSDTSFGAGFLVADRWRFGNNSSYGNYSNYTITQSTDAPAGFGNSLKFVVGNDAGTPTSSSASVIDYYFEGQDVQSLEYGTASAKTTIASFWVKSSIVGKYGISLSSGDRTKSHANNFTVDVANTWEKKTVTFAGNTSLNLTNDNSKQLMLSFYPAYGSDFQTSNITSWQNARYYGGSGNVNLGDTLGASMQISGVQLEVGSVATDFEHRSYGEELALCQRYYQKLEHNAVMHVGRTLSANRVDATIHFPVTMRASPTLNTSTITYGSILIADDSSFSPSSPTIARVHGSIHSMMIRFTCSESVVAGLVASVQLSMVEVDAEL